MSLVESKIRLATAEDAAEMAAIYAPFCTDTAITFETVALTPEMMADRWRHLGERFPWLVMEGDGGVLGYAYAGPHHERAAYRWAVNVSLYVRDDVRRQKVGTRLYRAMFDLLRLQGFGHAIAGITLPNDPSVALHESFGFKLVGVYPQVGFKLRAWRDVGWWQLPLAEQLTEPQETLPISAVQSLPKFARILAER